MQVFCENQQLTELLSLVKSIEYELTNTISSQLDTSTEAQVM